MGAKQCMWAAVTPGARCQAFNTVNGDNFRWEWMWGEVASYFGLTPAPYPEKETPMVEQMADAAPVWAEMAARYGLIEADLSKVASFWHSDLDLGRPMDILTDTTKCREIGFTEHQSTKKSFFHYFDLMKAAKVIPA